MAQYDELEGRRPTSFNRYRSTNLQARYDSLEALFYQMFKCVDTCNGYESAKRLMAAYENMVKE